MSSNISVPVSLANTGELRKLILENPKLPLIIFCGEESYSGEYCYNMAEVRSCVINELTIKGEYYIEKDAFEEELYIENEADFKSEEELKEFVDNIMTNTEFSKAIVVYVG